MHLGLFSLTFTAFSLSYNRTVQLHDTAGLFKYVWPFSEHQALKA